MIQFGRQSVAAFQEPQPTSDGQRPFGSSDVLEGFIGERWTMATGLHPERDVSH